MSIVISPFVSSDGTKKTPRPITVIDGIPVHVYAMSLASIVTILAMLWDVSWHATILQTNFLSPPHTIIYLAAVCAGLLSGIQLIWNTYRSSAGAKKGLVKIGMFYSSQGALFCISGAILVLAAAPFIDVWNGAFVPHVDILSPHHFLLAPGMLLLQAGACVSITKYLNRIENDAIADSLIKTYWIKNNVRQKRILKMLFIICAASLLCLACALFTPYLQQRAQHTALFYEAATAIALLLLPLFWRVLRIKWSMTIISIVYFLIAASASWIVQQLPAIPDVGEINNYQPLSFPLLFFIPAMAMDRVMQKVKQADWIKAVLLATVFGAILLAVQYPFSTFLVESAFARNWFFGADSVYPGVNPNAAFRSSWRPQENQYFPIILLGALKAIIAGIFIARISLGWGNRMQRIRR